MPSIRIEITEQPNGVLEPKTGRVTHVKRGDKVVIVPEAGATDLHIEFKGGRSPLGVKVAYDKELDVTAAFVSGGQQDANRYPYDCRFTKNGRELKSAGGGVLEIDPGG